MKQLNNKNTQQSTKVSNNVPQPSLTNKPSLYSKPLTNQVKVENPKISIVKQSYKLQTSTRNQNVEKQEMQFLKVKNVKITLLRSREVAKKIQEIEDLLKIKAEKINLELITHFESESDLTNLTYPLQQIGSRVYNLNWSVKGNISDGGSRGIGESLSKFSQLYSLNLLVTTVFGDKSASTLAAAIKRFVNLRILKLNIQISEIISERELTSKGNQKLNDAINTLEQLEFIDYEGYEWDNTHPFKNLSNYVFQIEELYDEEDDNSGLVNENYEQFKQEMEPIKSRLIDLKIRNVKLFLHEGGCICCLGTRLSYRKYYEIYLRLLSQVSELPYLTNFNEEYSPNLGEEWDSDEDNYQFEKQNEFETSVKQQIKQRYITVIQIRVFNINIQEQMSVNPAMILTDLQII